MNITYGEVKNFGQRTKAGTRPEAVALAVPVFIIRRVTRVDRGNGTMRKVTMYLTNRDGWSRDKENAGPILGLAAAERRLGKRHGEIINAGL